jgi:hypothetical protein
MGSAGMLTTAPAAFSRLRNSQVPKDLPRQNVVDLSMPRHSRDLVIGGIEVDTELALVS